MSNYVDTRENPAGPTHRDLCRLEVAERRHAARKTAPRPAND